MLKWSYHSEKLLVFISNSYWISELHIQAPYMERVNCNFTLYTTEMYTGLYHFRWLGLITSQLRQQECDRTLQPNQQLFNQQSRSEVWSSYTCHTKMADSIMQQRNTWESPLDPPVRAWIALPWWVMNIDCKWCSMLFMLLYSHNLFVIPRSV